MAAVRGRNTAPEMAVRRALHAAGLRFRLHVAKLSGRPDIVLARWRAVIQVHGCFWHAHGCGYSRLPTTRVDFWKRKITGNSLRDFRTSEALRSAGWRVFTVWECELRSSADPCSGSSLGNLVAAIRGRGNPAALAQSLRRVRHAPRANTKPRSKRQNS